uniref:Uncharacterized protein n=1 Tax=Fagus sylvatica TaxID=28930 RepID=A0A2N9I8C2_FAGSY
MWESRSSPAADVWWASGLGIYSSSSFFDYPNLGDQGSKSSAFPDIGCGGCS